MSAPDLSWTTVLLSDSSAVSFVGDWSGNATSSFHNTSNPETVASVAYTFHGTQACAVGLFDGYLLTVFITRGLGIPYMPILASPSYDECTDDPSETCPSAFYTTPPLQCNQYTLNLTVLPNQAMQLKEFGFVPCGSDDDDQTSSGLGTVATTAHASAASSTAVIAAEKKEQLDTGMIVGAVVGALVALALTSLALFIFLRRSRRMSRQSSSSSPSSPASPSPLPFFARSRPWLRLAGPQPKRSTSSTQFLAPISTLLPVAASGDITGGRKGHGRPKVMLVDAPAGTSSSAAAAAAAQASTSVPSTTTNLPFPTLPWLFDQSAAYYPNSSDGQQQHANRDAEWSGIVEKQPLRIDTEMDTGAGLAVAHGYLPDSKEVMAWGEREQGVDPRTTRTAADPEALPRYQTRGSLQWPS